MSPLSLSSHCTPNCTSQASPNLALTPIHVHTTVITKSKKVKFITTANHTLGNCSSLSWPRPFWTIHSRPCSMRVVEGPQGNVTINVNNTNPAWRSVEYMHAESLTYWKQNLTTIVPLMASTSNWSCLLEGRLMAARTTPSHWCETKHAGYV